MGPLRLGVHGLPVAEAGLVRALLRLLQSGGPSTLHWAFAADGPCDALVSDHADSRLPEAAAERGARAVLQLAPADAPPSDHALPRPLQAGPLEAWLLRTQERLLGVAAPTLASTTLVAPDGAPDGARFKLTRWPPPELLRAEPQRLRMASLLSRRHLSAMDLVRLVEVDEARVHTFIQLLQNFQLLHIETPDSPRAPVPAPARRDVDWSLLRSLRRRLGI